MPAFFTGVTFWSFILLVLGIAFLTAELFHPGFGAFGILGLVAFGLDILISAKTFAQGLLFTAIAALIVLVFLVLGARLISKGKLPKKLVLKDENGGAEGFYAMDSYAALSGKTGNAVTVLRPSGIALIDGERVDVVTRGEMIEKDAPVRVVEVEGGRIVVALYSERS